MIKLFALLLLALLLLPMYAGLRRMRNLPQRPPEDTTRHPGPDPAAMRGGARTDTPDPIATEAHES